MCELCWPCSMLVIQEMGTRPAGLSAEASIRGATGLTRLCLERNQTPSAEPVASLQRKIVHGGEECPLWMSAPHTPHITTVVPHETSDWHVA